MITENTLRDAAEAICEQLCSAAAGDLQVRLDVSSADLTAQKLAMLGNAVLHVARRAVATADQAGQELADAHEMAHLGTYRIEVTAGFRSWHWSAQLHKVFGADPAEFVPCEENWLALIHPADRREVCLAHDRALGGCAQSFEWSALCLDGVERRIWTEVRPLIGGSEIIGLRGVCQDVTERRAAEERIRHLAEHDALTGLSNRTVLHRRLGQMMTRNHRRAGKPASLALLYIDLDGFKAVNDQHGHAAGDSVLLQATQRMQAVCRGSDILARLGGDEFAIAQAAAEQPAAAETLAGRLIAVLGKPYELRSGGETVTVTASIGAAVGPGDANDVDGLIGAADAAMYRAKAAGKNGVAFYRPEIEREMLDRRALEADLRQAISRDELFVAYQPLVAVADGEVLGHEALLRWQHRERGPVAPDVFIPVAEASGAIWSIGEWTLEQACSEATRWPAPMFVAVNVSPVQVQRGKEFAEMVERVLARTGLDPTRLELEVTEGVLIREVSRVLEALGRVRQLGVRIALDDFGTGYSSLATLQAFPFDKIKVDRRFIAGLGGGSPQDAAIVRAVLGLARGLGLPVVAEGVETAPQWEALRAERCAEAQGWLFGRPGAPLIKVDGTMRQAA